MHSCETSGTVTVPVTSSSPSVPVGASSEVVLPFDRSERHTFPLHDDSTVVNGEKPIEDSLVSDVQMVSSRARYSLALSLTEIDIPFNFSDLCDLHFLAVLFR